MKAIIPNAIPQRNYFPGKADIYSTRTFFEFCPDFYLHLIPEQQVKIDLNSFGRTLPMPVPTMGKCDIAYRAFFVPYSSVFRGWYDFIANTQHVNSINSVELLPMVRTFNENNFIDLLIAHCDVITPAAGQPAPEHFTFFHNGDYYNIADSFGLAMWKIFHSLGYRLRGDMNPSDDVPYNALPLLALCRIYVDYYFPSQFRDLALYNDVVGLLNYDAGDNELGLVDLEKIFRLLECTCYDDNIFVDAFTKPTNPNTPFNGIQIIPVDKDIRPQNIENTNAQNAPILNFATQISQTALNWLQRVTMYFKRNQIAGSFAYERLLTRFGLRINNDVSKYLDTYLVPVNVGDVMSTTDNYDAATDSGAQLGSYSGKAMAFDPSNNPGKFLEFTAPDFGIFIVIASVLPRAGMFQGVDRHNLHLTPFDFYTPEYDAVSPQAIHACEIYTFHGASVNASDSDLVFGFAPSYYEYKTYRDNVIGDYTNGAVNAGMDAYFMFRTFKDSDFGNYAGIFQTMDFVRAQDRFQYLRMFGIDYDASDPNAGVPIDPFRIHTTYNIESYANMRKLYDDVEFDQLQHLGSGSSEVNVSGAKLN